MVWSPCIWPPLCSIYIALISLSLFFHFSLKNKCPYAELHYYAHLLLDQLQHSLPLYQHSPFPTQQKLIIFLLSSSLINQVWIADVSGWSMVRFSTACRALFESEIAANFSLVLFSIIDRTAEIAYNSAVKIIAFGLSLYLMIPWWLKAAHSAEFSVFEQSVYIWTLSLCCSIRCLINIILRPPGIVLTFLYQHRSRQNLASKWRGGFSGYLLVERLAV